MKAILLVFFIFSILLSFVFGCVEESNVAWLEQETPWPTWILSHWVWDDNVSSVDQLYQLLDDYEAHNIPVGVIIIDAYWLDRYTNFQWNTTIIPDPQKMIDDFHNCGVKVVLWMDCFYNTNNSDYEEKKELNYFIGDGQVLTWWLGEGSLVDFDNPAAVEWWHGMMDPIFEMGIDGWKVDGTDFWAFFIPPGGFASWDLYRDDFYRDTFEYTWQKLGNNGIMLARPVDTYDLEVVAKFCPQDIFYTGWVGDQDPDWIGLENAFLNMVLSAKHNYLSFGSDISGYRGSVRTKELLIRWAQLGAFCAVMENGGNGEFYRRPWNHDEETVEIYRKFVQLHYDLMPYFQREMIRAHQDNRSIWRPPNYTWDYYTDGSPILKEIDYSFKLGRDIFVAPIFDDTLTRSISFPHGDDWVDWWDRSIVYKGGTTIQYDCPLDRFPVFLRKGATLPVD